MQDELDEVPRDDQQVPQLSAIELRVLGTLMEKQLTTPDQYPLTVNSILNACNQKSSREPITNYQQGEVVRTLQGLDDRHFVRKEYGSRAEKYSQQFMSYLELGKKQQAVLCLMMLRGPQTLSELYTRTQRMALFTDRDELAHCVERLCERAMPLATTLASQSGRRGERFSHLFCGLPDPSQIDAHSPVKGDQFLGMHGDATAADTLSLLESEVAELRDTISALQRENRIIRQQLERLHELTGHPVPDSDATDPPE